MDALNESQRREVFGKVLDAIDRKFMGPEPDTKALRERHEAMVVQSATAEDFEQALTDLLKDLGTSHTGIFHEGRPRAAGRIAIAATFAKAETPDGQRWLFQDVHPGGIAAQAGVRAGDVLLTIGDREFRPPEAMPFTLGQAYTFTRRTPRIRRRPTPPYAWPQLIRTTVTVCGCMVHRQVPSGFQMG
jgi:hypothetical protein